MIAIYAGHYFMPVYIDREMLLAQMEMYQAEIDEAKPVKPPRPRKKPGMPTGYKYEYVECPDCGGSVPENWIIKHYKSNCTVGVR